MNLPSTRLKTLFRSSLWPPFFCFLVTNTLLSYFPLSWQAKLGMGLLGLLLPWVFAHPSGRPGTDGKSFLSREFLPPIRPWAWGLLAAAVLFLRFYKLTTLSVWPLYDEGMYGYYAAELSKQWNWQFLYGSSQAPPLYLWLEAGLFKVFGVSLFTLWLLPALLSTLLFPAGYWAARGLFSRSLSFICACLMGFTFWPLYVGRFSLMTGLVLLAECLVLGLLARFWATPPAAVSRKTVSLLGLATGLGFYTYLHWPVMAAMVFLTLLFWARNRRKKGGAVLLLWFLLAGLTAVLPLAWGIWREGSGQLFFYLKHLSAGRASSLGDQLGISLSYVASLFWGMDLKYHTYQPVWGGYLNPVLGAFFFLGLLETLRRRREPLSLWLISGLFLFILPGVLTSERATSRMILVFPILAVLAAFGIKSLWSRKSASLPLFLALALLSLGLDFYHLDFAYPGLWKSLDNWKSYEKSYSRYQAFKALEEIRRERGPGYILADFVPGLADETLRVACFDFNLAFNPRLAPGPSPWAAVLANANLLPFLKTADPAGKAYWVSKDLAAPDGGWMLWVVPVDAAHREEVGRWRKASLALKPYLESRLLYIPGQPLTVEFNPLEQAFPAARGEPLLESCFLEEEGDLYLRAALAASNPPRKGDLKPSETCLEAALRKGYPSAHLYFKLGNLFWMGGEPSRARRAFQDAVKAPLDLTDSARLLKFIPGER